MTEIEYLDRLMELKDVLNDAIVRHEEENAPQSEVDAAQAAYDYHLVNRDILITE